MMRELLRIENLAVEIEGNRVLQGLELHVGKGELHVILGPNAVGKSTLLAAVMGLSHIHVVEGRVLFEGRDITDLPPNERARLGIALAFQISPELVGVKFKILVVELAKRFGTSEFADRLVDDLRLKHLLERDAFRGFSGGERKRAELLLTVLQRPKLALLDEPDSGVDLESLKLMADAINFLVNEFGSSVLLVTHTGEILEELKAGIGHVLLDGRIAYSGKVEKILEAVKEVGFKEAVIRLMEGE